MAGSMDFMGAAAAADARGGGAALPRGLNWLARVMDWCGALGVLAHRAIAGVFGWIEDLLVEVNAPALILVGVVAAVAVMSNGALLADWPWLNQGWPLALAVGVDIMAIIAIRYAVACGLRFLIVCREVGFRAGLIYAGMAALWICVVVVLAGVLFTANQVFGYQLMTGASEAQALAKFGITPDAFVASRAGLVAGLTVLTGVVLAMRQLSPLVARLAYDIMDTPPPAGPVERSNARPLLPPLERSAPAGGGARGRRPQDVPAAGYERERDRLNASAAAPRNRSNAQALEAQWVRLAQAYCADKPDVGGATLRRYLVRELGEDRAPGKAKAQELAVRFRPPALRLGGPRGAAATV